MKDSDRVETKVMCGENERCHFHFFLKLCGNDNAILSFPSQSKNNLIIYILKKWINYNFIKKK